MKTAVVKNDIAVIRLTERIARSPKADWICLPHKANVYDQDVLKVVSYNHQEDESIQEQVDVRVLDNRQSQSECQRQLTDIAEDAFCALSTSSSSYLGVVSWWWTGDCCEKFDAHFRATQEQAQCYQISNIAGIWQVWCPSEDFINKFIQPWLMFPSI